MSENGHGHRIRSTGILNASTRTFSIMHAYPHITQILSVLCEVVTVLYGVIQSSKYRQKEVHLTDPLSSRLATLSPVGIAPYLETPAICTSKYEI